MPLYTPRADAQAFGVFFRGKLGAILGFEPLYLLTRIVFVAVFLVVFCFCDQAPLPVILHTLALELGSLALSEGRFAFFTFRILFFIPLSSRYERVRANAPSFIVHIA